MKWATFPKNQMKIKFIHYKCPKAGQELDDEQKEKFATQLRNFLAWMPLSILRKTIEKFYNESQTFKDMVKDLVDKK